METAVPRYRVPGNLGNDGNRIDVVIDESQTFLGMLRVAVEGDATAEVVKSFVTGRKEVQASWPALHCHLALDQV
jgi:hypothetical protein